MKVLVIYVSRFAFTPGEKNLESAGLIPCGAEYKEALLAFIQLEQHDEEEDVSGREKKLVNHLKWALRKNNCHRIVLHSFAHLSSSKASVEYSKQVLDMAEVRLKNAGIETYQTPFGYFLNLSIEAPGFSLARIWADL